MIPRQSASEALRRLQESGLRVFTLRDAATILGRSLTATAHRLEYLSREVLVQSLRSGVWTLTSAHPTALEAVPVLTSPWPGYVSFHSALVEHGLLSQIPAEVMVATARRAAKWKTPLGSFRLIHLASRWMWGYAMVQRGTGRFPLAFPEKAVLDVWQVSRSFRYRSWGRLLTPTLIKRLDAKQLKSFSRRAGVDLTFTKFLGGS